MDKYNLIGIHATSISTDMSTFAKKGVYRTIPMILYEINSEPVKSFYIKRPIEIFREKMSVANIKNIAVDSKQDISFLTIPGKAYDKMQQYVNRNVNKVIADMIAYVVVKVINQEIMKNPDKHNVFFIDGVDTNKIIGRLGYLYLDSNCNTIVFLTHKTGSLMTNILNMDKDELEFDINYFKDKIHENDLKSNIIPYDFMESMTQTVFYNIPDKEAHLVPLRCDIFSQGISKNIIYQKSELISEILHDNEAITIPFQEKDDGLWVRIPIVLYDCIRAFDIYKKIAEAILEEEYYE